MLIELKKNSHNQPILIFMNKEFLLTNEFGLHKVLEELRSLNTGLEIKFENFRQLQKLINQINDLKS